MTNLVKLKSVDQFLADFTPSYIPLVGLFLARGKQYTIEEGKLNFKRIEAIGDLEAKHFGAKDTEMHLIHAKEGSKVYSKYFFAAKYIQSALQSQEGVDSLKGQVLDIHNKQADRLFLTGEGTDNDTVKNNGLFFSKDPNFSAIASYEVEKDSAGNHLSDLYEKVMEIYERANVVEGEKMILFYGVNTLKKLNGLFTETKTSLSKTLRDALPGVAINKIPVAVTPANAEGFLVVNMSQIDLHYTTLPIVRGEGVNEENEYVWTNFLLGSFMVDVKAADGICKQDVTYEA